MFDKKVSLKFASDYGFSLKTKLKPIENDIEDKEKIIQEKKAL